MTLKVVSQEAILEQISIQSELRVPGTIKRAMRKKSLTQVSSRHQNDSPQHKNKKFMKHSSIVARKHLQWFKVPLKNSSFDHKVQAYESCEICLGQINSSQFLSISDQCQHRFCRDCLHAYSIYQINLVQKVNCPTEGCPESLIEGCKLFEELPQKVKKQFKQHEKFLNISYDEKICPYEYCQGVLKMPQNPKTKKSIKCQKCQNMFCSLCLMKFHSGECDENSIFYFQASLHYRQCKKCNTVIQRITGCDHMTCKCGYQFCYKCGTRWSSDHQCHNTPDCCFQVPICWIFWKLMYILAYLLIGYPLILFRTLALLAMLIASALTMGFFAGSCVILQKLYHKSPYLLFVGLIFFPVVLILGVVLMLKDILEEAGPSIFSMDILCGPCLTIMVFCEEVRHRDYS